MPGPFTPPPHRAKGSWIPRFAGAAVVVVVAGGGLAIYLGTARGHEPVKAKQHHSGPSVKVVSVQTIGLVDFGPYDDGDPWQNDYDDHPLMLVEKASAVDFVLIPRSQITTGTPEWTANQMSSGGEIFIYVPNGQCLTAMSNASTSTGSSAAGGLVGLTHCDLGLRQRWRPVHARVLLGEPIAQYQNVATRGCLTAGGGPGSASKQGPARLAACGPAHGAARAKNQEIAFWWSA
jgi:hypothetical protein